MSASFFRRYYGSCVMELQSFSDRLSSVLALSSSLILNRNESFQVRLSFACRRVHVAKAKVTSSRHSYDHVNEPESSPHDGGGGARLPCCNGREKKSERIKCVSLMERKFGWS